MNRNLASLGLVGAMGLAVAGCGTMGKALQIAGTINGGALGKGMKAAGMAMSAADTLNDLHDEQKPAVHSQNYSFPSQVGPDEFLIGTNWTDLNGDKYVQREEVQNPAETFFVGQNFVFAASLTQRAGQSIAFELHKEGRRMKYSFLPGLQPGDRFVLGQSGQNPLCVQMNGLSEGNYTGIWYQVAGNIEQLQKIGESNMRVVGARGVSGE